MDIYLAKFGDKGCSASVESHDGEDQALIITSKTGTAMAVCLKAAKILREQSDKFYKLAHEQDPYDLNAQERINEGK